MLGLPQRKDSMLVYGHRGAGGEAPENTIAGCKHAIARGVQYLELDMRLSKDDQLVMLHDDTVNRTTDQQGKVSTYTVAELKKMDARRSGTPWPNKRDTGIVTLDAIAEGDTRNQGVSVRSKNGLNRSDEPCS